MKADVSHSGMNPFQRGTQITVPSSPPVRAMVAEMIDSIRKRRAFQGKAVNKQVFYNCIVLGLHDLEAKRDATPEELESEGPLAIVFDRGADRLAKMIASADAPTRRKGVPVAIDAGDGREAPAVARTRRPRPMLVIPRGWSVGQRDGGDVGRNKGRAEEEHQAGGGHPFP